MLIAIFYLLIVLIDRQLEKKIITKVGISPTYISVGAGAIRSISAWTVCVHYLQVCTSRAHAVRQKSEPDRSLGVLTKH